MSFKQDEYHRLHFVPVYILKRDTSMVDEPRAQRANALHRRAVEHLNIQPTKIGSATSLVSRHPITGGPVYVMCGPPHRWKRMMSMLTSQFRARQIGKGAQGPVLLDAHKIMTVALMYPSEFVLTAAAISGRGDPMCQTSCCEVFLNVNLSERLVTENAGGIAAVISLLRGLIMAFDGKGLSTEWRIRAIRRWICLDDVMRSHSLHKTGARGREFEHEPQQVLGVPSGLLMIIRANCDTYLQYMKYRTAGKTLGDTIFSGRGFTQYRVESLFSEIVQMYGFKPDAANVMFGIHGQSAYSKSD